MSRLTPELDQWLASQKARGCEPASMVAAMVTAGHPRKFAEEAVAALFNGKALQPAEGVAALANDEVRKHIMNAPNAIEAAGHSVEVLFAMAKPRIVLFGNVLTAAECDELIAQSRPKLKRAEVVDPATGLYKVDDSRTSEGTHFARGETALISRIEARVAELTGIEVPCQEPLQILHYGIGGEYEPHYDFFDPGSSGESTQLKNGGQRVATLVMYLNDVDAGGATLFPQVGVETKPQRGHAVYFENVDESGRTNPQTLHAGAPVGKGEKWIATKWLREKPYVV
jgi:prolyl 4-hydroxylase